ncbi:MULTISPECIES: hypothetical protein [Salinicola]|uniref:Uncharacterized protein n=1 Tax=Salinicola socius TaxID=404433 RepID=A0A1Q8SVB2_9GAMM|nr:MULTISPECIES: hypothetical protein [Salinicola]OLO05312.1 hypothetical protein BTW07_04590 [Salinicola socius]
MSNRYFVRIVNSNMPDEHFVVADFRRNGACMNVYFNRPAAMEEARWLNRHHHRQQLKSAQFCGQHDFHLTTTLPPSIEPAASISLPPDHVTGNHSPDSETIAAHPPPAQTRESAAQAVKKLMTQRLVRS